MKDKKTNKVIATDRYMNKCECGELVAMSLYARHREASAEIVDKVFLGICKCGNIFVAKYGI